jgi:hypothetical protein
MRIRIQQFTPLQIWIQILASNWLKALKVLKLVSYSIHFGLSSGQMDAVPDPAYHFDVDPDPDFYFMQMRIHVTKMMRIHADLASGNFKK